MPSDVALLFAHVRARAFGWVASVPPRPLLPGLARLRRQYVEVLLLGPRDVGFPRCSYTSLSRVRRAPDTRDRLGACPCKRPRTPVSASPDEVCIQSSRVVLSGGVSTVPWTFPRYFLSADESSAETRIPLGGVNRRLLHVWAAHLEIREGTPSLSPRAVGLSDHLDSATGRDSASARDWFEADRRPQLAGERSARLCQSDPGARTPDRAGSRQPGVPKLF
jgi:hypothetical protein